MFVRSIRAAASVVCTVAVIGGCSPPESQSDRAISDVPAWAADAIWYQIFVERFRNGDPDNDPRVKDIQGSDPGVYPADWSVTPWTHDWYRQEDWARKTGKDFYFTAQLRRYGGDLQGVLDKLDYLEQLGVTAIYFNPLNDAPSLHKYDARNYRHIDRNFGPDPDGDAAAIELEVPDDPATWTWTSADRLFLVLIDSLHARDMKLIMDYSWNHTGITFWAWKDVLMNQSASRYSDWYDVERFDDPATTENEFAYEGWAGVSSLPNLRKVGVPESYHGGPVEGDLNPGAKAHVLNVTRRWLDPDGDGDPSDGVDGFRLDVAEKIPLGFWRDYRRFVKGINPDAYLVGEIWWEQWPDRMMDPRPYLGDVFDAVMNYRWYMPTRALMAGALPELDPSHYVAHLDSIERGVPQANLRVMMNVAATHDTPRLGTSLFNRGRYKYEAGGRNPEYKIGRPDARTGDVLKMLLVQQYTYVGAPHIWNGDEVGMWGADDPDNRKPLVWSDLRYEPERVGPRGRLKVPDAVYPDTALYRFHQRLAELRRSRPALFARGVVDYFVADDERGLLGYMRRHEADTVVVLFNRSDAKQADILPFVSSNSLLVASRPGVLVDVQAEAVALPPRTAAVFGRP